MTINYVPTGASSSFTGSKLIKPLVKPIEYKMRASLNENTIREFKLDS